MGRSPLVGAILGEWDEDVGPFIIEAKLDRKLKEKPEMILLKCFSSAQVIFSYEEFNKVSFIIPFLFLGVRAKVFFNLKPDPAVRGGLRPFIFIILLDIEDSIDDHFKLFENEAEQFQQDYQNGFKINFDKMIKKIREIAEKNIKIGPSNQESIKKQPKIEIVNNEIPEQPIERELNKKIMEEKNKKDQYETTRDFGKEKETAIGKEKENAIGKEKETESENGIENENGNGKTIDILPSTVDIICNLCGKSEHLNISKEAIGPLKEIPHKIILKHENHSIKVLIDSDYRLIGIHYVKNQCAPDEREKQLKTTNVNRKLFTVKFGPWTQEELEILRNEIEKKTPLHIIQLKTSRTITQIKEQAEKLGLNLEEKY